MLGVIAKNIHAAAAYHVECTDLLIMPNHHNLTFLHAHNICCAVTVLCRHQSLDISSGTSTDSSQDFSSYRYAGMLQLDDLAG